jgi:hypothetical protein
VTGTVAQNLARSRSSIALRWKNIQSRYTTNHAPHDIHATRRSRLLVGAVVAAPVVAVLTLLRTEIVNVQVLNDGGVHEAMIRWAARAIRAGRLPFDGWFPYLSTGAPQFHQYQSLPHVVMGTVATIAGADRTYRWSLYLLLAAWPVAVYFGAKLLEWDPWTAAAAAVISPLLVSNKGYGFELDSYTWRGLGVWAQLWAMVGLPLVFGLLWRSLKSGRSIVLAALALGLLFDVHVITGYFAFLVLGVWLLVGPSPWRLRVRRTVLVGLGAALVAMWIVVPTLVDRRWSTANPFMSGFWTDSYGARAVLSWLFTGKLFDSGRFPTITVLVFVGLVICLVRLRRDVRARALVSMFLLGLALYFGPKTWGRALNLLPGSSALLFHRYILAVQFPGIVLAAVGGATLARGAFRVASSIRVTRHQLVGAAAVVVVAVGWLFPALKERALYTANARSLVQSQELSEALDQGNRDALIAAARDRRDGRIYAGLPSNWGHSYDVGEVPGYFSVLNADAEGIGFTFRTGSMLNAVEPWFNESDPVDYDVFNVRYLLLPASMEPPVHATLIAGRGEHNLWSVPTSGYFMVVDTIGPLRVNSDDYSDQMSRFLRSRDIHSHLFPTLAFGHAPGASATLPGAVAPGTPAGVVSNEVSRSELGVYDARIRANRTAAIVLKASFHPRWTASIDGRRVHPYLVAPGYVAATVRTGDHDVVFRYRSYTFFPFLLCLIVAGLSALWWVGRRVERTAPNIIRD